LTFRLLSPFSDIDSAQCALSSGVHPGEGFWGSKPLPFGSKSNVTYG